MEFADPVRLDVRRKVRGLEQVLEVSVLVLDALTTFNAVSVVELVTSLTPSRTHSSVA